MKARFAWTLVTVARLCESGKALGLWHVKVGVKVLGRESVGRILNRIDADSSRKDVLGLFIYSCDSLVLPDRHGGNAGLSSHFGVVLYYARKRRTSLARLQS